MRTRPDPSSENHDELAARDRVRLMTHKMDRSFLLRRFGWFDTNGNRLRNNNIDNVFGFGLGRRALQSLVRCNGGRFGRLVFGGSILCRFCTFRPLIVVRRLGCLGQRLCFICQGDAYSPFSVTGDPNKPNFVVPNIGLSDLAEVNRLGRRATLRQKLDTLERAFDQAGELQALDEFETQAMTLLTNPKAKYAFDLSNEDDRTRDRYGRNTWGQQLLMARRLVEAGVDVLSTSLSGPLCGRVNNWDDHAVNHHVFDALRFRSQAYDQAVSALIEDIYERGLDKRVLVVVTGEFGRTPKITYQPSTGAGNASAPAGTKQPGRDHWPRGFSNIWAGGGIETGCFIGATDTRGEDSIERICGAGDFLATIYHHLGIDSSKVLLRDFNGRPTSIVVDPGKPIPELMG